MREAVASPVMDGHQQAGVKVDRLVDGRASGSATRKCVVWLGSSQPGILLSQAATPVPALPSATPALLRTARRSPAHRWRR